MAARVINVAFSQFIIYNFQVFRNKFIGNLITLTFFFDEWFGGSKKIAGVTITTVPAVHSNGIAGAMIGGELGDMLDESGLTAYAGPPTGYVVTFSNGLSVYLSGDTGITAEQDSVVRQHYGVQLAIMNIGDTFTTGPKEAAFVVNELIKPASVIASHANELATRNGKVLPGTRTE